jgi:hypothetical protein
MNVFMYLNYKDRMNFLYFSSHFNLFILFNCYLFQNSIEINYHSIENMQLIYDTSSKQL